MKRKLYILAVFMFVILLGTSTALAAKPIQTDGEGNETAWESTNIGCAAIQDGTITDSAGNPLSTGYDQFGYNYQAHMFNGTYDSSDRILDGMYWGQTGDFVDDNLMMKWSDAWLANVDCDNDGKLDRGLVNGEVGGTSLGWETNHVEGDYFDTDGNVQHYTYFVKIVWTGTGPLWGAYTTIEEVYNDPSAGYQGLSFKVGAPGFGLNDQWTTLP